MGVFNTQIWYCRVIITFSGRNMRYLVISFETKQLLSDMWLLIIYFKDIFSKEFPCNEIASKFLERETVTHSYLLLTAYLTLITL